MTTLASGDYLIINKFTKQALDNNTEEALQLSGSHPRVFVNEVCIFTTNDDCY
jgi:hypothetical protein